jgi:hypothetical protein
MPDRWTKNKIKSNLFFFLQIFAGPEFTSEIMAGSISVPFDSVSNSNGRSEIDDMINPLSNYNEQLDIDATIDPSSNRKLLWNTYL